ncbi:MAG: 23S rRNA (adenine(2503)-C(2))-methyltransferase RlmN [Acidobacteria bacterium]|nr:23S rRNA (adenine(2503)-C(2))-methyltransferase RlmN [Acidobacteriota bacterium]
MADKAAATKKAVSMPTIELTDLTRAEIESALRDLGVESYRAGQLFHWIYQRGVSDFASMTNLSQQVRRTLVEHFHISTPAIARRDASEDGTEKFLLALRDQRHIESVYIPDTRSQTFCVSTQVGCAMGCAFCLTATMGLVRNLTPGEIVGQVRVLSAACALRGKAFNIVLMGMGEPLHNYDHTMAALRILCDRKGCAVPPRRITLSTVGLVPAIDRLAAEPLMPNLAISLHAVSEDVRARLVPAAYKYSIADILGACRRLPLKQRDRVTFEYVLLAGVNDADAEARKLARLLRGLPAKVNLIPLNPAAGIPFERPSDERINQFGRILAEHHVTVSVRKSRGRDIRAACGQLAIGGGRKSPAQKLADEIE